MSDKKATPVAAPGRRLFYVVNPVMLGQMKYLIKVVGYDEIKGKTAPYVIPRGHVLDAPVNGAEAALQKWAANLCIEPYDPKRHPDAITEPVELASLDEMVTDDEPLGPVVDKKPTSQSKAIVDPSDPPVLEDAPKPKSKQATTISGAKARY